MKKPDNSKLTSSPKRAEAWQYYANYQAKQIAKLELADKARQLQVLIMQKQAKQIAELKELLSWTATCDPLGEYELERIKQALKE